METRNLESAEGIVMKSLPNAMYRVRMKNGNHVLAHVSGILRLHYISIMPGDRVSVALTGPDKARGRILLLL